MSQNKRLAFVALALGLCQALQKVEMSADGQISMVGGVEKDPEADGVGVSVGVGGPDSQWSMEDQDKDDAEADLLERNNPVIPVWYPGHTDDDPSPWLTHRDHLTHDVLSNGAGPVDPDSVVPNCSTFQCPHGYKLKPNANEIETVGTDMADDRDRCCNCAACKIQGCLEQAQFPRANQAACERKGGTWQGEGCGGCFQGPARCNTRMNKIRCESKKADSNSVEWLGK